MKKSKLKQIIKEEFENQQFSQIRVADFIEKHQSQLTREPLYQEQPISHTIEFLKKGRPSQFYLKKLIDKLTHLGFDLDPEMFRKEETNLKPEIKPDSDINPYKQPGGKPSKGYMGARYTGD